MQVCAHAVFARPAEGEHGFGRFKPFTGRQRPCKAFGLNARGHARFPPGAHLHTAHMAPGINKVEAICVAVEFRRVRRAQHEKRVAKCRRRTGGAAEHMRSGRKRNARFVALPRPRARKCGEHIIAAGQVQLIAERLFQRDRRVCAVFYTKAPRDDVAVRVHGIKQRDSHALRRGKVQRQRLCSAPGRRHALRRDTSLQPAGAYKGKIRRTRAARHHERKALGTIISLLQRRQLQTQMLQRKRCALSPVHHVATISDIRFFPQGHGIFHAYPRAVMQVFHKATAHAQIIARVGRFQREPVPVYCDHLPASAVYFVSFLSYYLLCWFSLPSSMSILSDLSIKQHKTPCTLPIEKHGASGYNKDRRKGVSPMYSTEEPVQSVQGV